MTTQVTINRKPTTYSLSQTEVGSALAADLVLRGYDGTCWIGVSIPTGRQAKRTNLFYRTQSGNFEMVA